MRYNNTTIGSVTNLYININDSNGTNLSNYIAQWDDSTSSNNGYIIIKDNSNFNNLVNVFYVSGTVTLTTGGEGSGSYYTVPVTYVSGVRPTNGENLAIEFIKTGDLGYTGSRGYSGSQGYTGSVGIGYTGSQGTTGYTGSRGYTGSVGYTGSIGYSGSQGYTGSQGGIGYTGSKGDIGYTGSQGEIGYTGSQGEIGYTGSQGEIGYTGSIGIGYTGSASDVIGYTGSQGEIGYTGSRSVGFYYGSFHSDNTTSLTADINSNTTADLAVVSTSGFPTSGALLIGVEILSYTGTDATHFTGITRGVSGSNNSSHSNGDAVSVAQVTTAGVSARVLIDVQDLSNGVTLNAATSEITIVNAGTYNAMFSVQTSNAGNVADNIAVWFVLNGNHIPSSASYVTTQQIHNNFPGACVVAANIFYTFSAGDKLTLEWTTISGTSVLTTYPAVNTTIPISPAVILTINQIA